MRIKIKKENNVDELFISYLIKKIQKKTLEEINLKKLIPWNEFFNLQFKNNKLIKNISSKEILLLGLHHLTWIEFKDYYLIEINDKVLYRNTNKTVSSLCRTIDRGTLSIRGYPLISKNFSYIEKNIDKLKKQFEQEGYLYAGIRII